MPDPKRGQVIKAFVVLKPNLLPSDELEKEIKNFVKSQIAPYKVPKEVEFVNELPKTETGKNKKN